jgi:enoyl-CoA hydratase/carnithine racemase
MSIRYETRDGIARIAIARPAKKNALTVAMYQAMTDALAQADADDAVRSILFHGEPDVFTAGNDLEDFLKHPPGEGADAPVFRFMRALGGAGKPVVAAVNGPAVGIGTTLLLHCDLVYCAADARLSMPFVSLGVCAEFASSLLVPLAAGWPMAAEKLLLGDPISAAEALQMRLINRVLPPAEVLPHAIQQAARFNALPATSVRETKRLMKAGWRAAIDKIMVDEATTFGRLLRGADAKEAITAFLERRKPDFTRSGE